MNKPIIYGVLAFLLIIGLGGAFYKSRQNYQTQPTQTMPPMDMSTPMDMSNDSVGSNATNSAATTNKVKEFTVVGSSFKFEPAAIKVKKGDTVKITFQNSGGNHNFVIDEFSASTSIISSGKSETITFVANKTGSFEYYCMVGNHRQQGMKGILTVE